MKTFILFLLFSFSSFIVFSCGKEKTDSGSGIIHTAATLSPLAGFIEAIGGKYVSVTVTIPPNANHETFEPLPKDIAEISNADLYFKVGGTFHFEEIWLPKLTGGSKMKVIDCSQGISILENDPHIWLGPEEVRTIIASVTEALSNFRPEHRSFFEDNKKAYLARLDSADAKAKALLEPYAGKSFLVYHPAWRYYTRHYGITEIGIEQDGKEPNAADLKALIERARNDSIKVIFIEKQFDQTAAESIAREIGARIQPIDPLAKDFPANLLSVAELIAGSFK